MDICHIGSMDRRAVDLQRVKTGVVFAVIVFYEEGHYKVKEGKRREEKELVQAKREEDNREWGRGNHLIQRVAIWRHSS